MPVQIYFVREGAQDQSGDAVDTPSLMSCVEKIGLTKEHWLSPLDEPSPRFGDQSVRLSKASRPKYLVIKLDEEEAKASGWKAGYYQIDLTPEEVKARLGEP